MFNKYIEGLDYVDYYKLLTLLIKEIKQLLKHTSFCQEGNSDNLYSSFNSKFQFGPQRLNKSLDKSNEFNKTPNRKFNFKIVNKENTENNQDFELGNYNNLNIKISEVEKEIMSIKLVFDEIMTHKKTYLNSVEMEKFLDNNNEINYTDFIQLLRIFGITYPRDKVFKILKFIKVENPQKAYFKYIKPKIKSMQNNFI